MKETKEEIKNMKNEENLNEKIEIKDVDENDDEMVGLGISIGTMIGSALGLILSFLFNKIWFLPIGISVGLIIGIILAGSHIEFKK